VLVDPKGRRIDYLRISITDRCNFRCIYCQSKGPFNFLPHEEILTFEEIESIVRVGVKLGVKVVRLTGGEPLLRKGIVELVAKLAKTPGLEDLSLTTNGYFLSELAKPLKEAGLKRINLSLDTLSEEKFSELTGGFSLKKVMDGLYLSLSEGFTAVKINSVIIRGFNDEECEELAKLSIELPVEVRFIEFMPVGKNSLWDESRVVPISEIKERVERLGKLWPAEKVGKGPAAVFRFEGAKGKVGFISPLSSHFCGSCNRLRVTADGRLRPCLFSDEEINLKDYLRGKKGSLEEAFREALRIKPEIGVKASTQRPMRAIGG
jgi:cyclic pyranopterin phosphate synthase